MSASQSPHPRPIVVDLDGTLIRTDMLLESVNHYVLKRPSSAYRLLGWLLRGRAALKAKLATSTELDVSALPLNEDLLDWLRQQRAAGRRLVLATATHHSLAKRIAAEIRIFDEVFASDETRNLKGLAKRDALVERFGVKGFDYVGNEIADMPIWQSAAEAFVASDSIALAERVRSEGNLRGVFAPRSSGRLRAVVKVLRPHQWVKNLLVFVPLLAAHAYGSVESLLKGATAFLVFGLTASSVYVLNDLADVSDDRLHPRKRTRPFAAGSLGILEGWVLWPLLLAVAFVIAAMLLGPLFLLTVAGYFVLTFAYSLRLKRGAIVDIIALAALYTMRILAGAAAIAVPLSFWLLAFSMFLFLSLGCVKRFSELKVAADRGQADRLPGRGYTPADMDIVSMLGVASGYIAVLVIALYIQDGATIARYRHPELIWFVCPLLLYWISRVWLYTHRGWMHDDPIVFALTDRISWVVAVLAAATFILAKVLP